MKKAILASAGVLIISSSAALAQAVYVDESYAAAPAYVAPAPVYVAPAPVYVAPAYVAPATTVIVRRTMSDLRRSLPPSPPSL